MNYFAFLALRIKIVHLQLIQSTKLIFQRLRKFTMSNFRFLNLSYITTNPFHFSAFSVEPAAIGPQEITNYLINPSTILYRVPFFSWILLMVL